MKVKIKTKDEYFDFVKLKCSAVEFLILKSALNEYAHTLGRNFEDKGKARLMLWDMEKGLEKCRQK